MTTPEPLFATDDFTWTPLSNPAAAGFSVWGIPERWSSAGTIRIDGLRAAAWMSLSANDNAPFTANAILFAWSTTITAGVLQTLSAVLGTPELDRDGPVIMAHPVISTDRPDLYVQHVDAVIQSPFGPLSSRVFHAIRRDAGDVATMARLGVTVPRADGYLLDRFELACPADAHATTPQSSERSGVR